MMASGESPLDIGHQFYENRKDCKSAGNFNCAKMLIAAIDHGVIAGLMARPQRNDFAINRQIADELERLGHGGQSELARVWGVAPSAVNNVINLKRKVSAAERDAFDDWYDKKMRERGQVARAGKARRSVVGKVPVVGYVVAGGEERRVPLPSGELDLVDAPEGVTDKTVAVQIRGNSMGDLYDRWYAFYDDVRAPLTDDLIGHLCVVGLTDDRIVIKKITPSRKPGRYNLISENAPAIRDVQIAWAARVKSIAPR